jgi:hypothetical protein
LGYRLKIMPITINGSGTVTGISAGGLPDDCIVTADIADNNVTTAKIANIGVTEIKIADGAVSRAKRSEDLTLETAKSATGISVDFTGIPSWARRITLMFVNVSLNNTANMLVRTGTSGGISSTNYASTSNYLTGNVGSSSANSTNGFSVTTAATAANSLSGQIVLSNYTGDSWIATGLWDFSNTTGTTGMLAGHNFLSGTLDRVSILSADGVGTFDNGIVNIMYE